MKAQTQLVQENKLKYTTLILQQRLQRLKELRFIAHYIGLSCMAI